MGMTASGFSHRLATIEDVPALHALMGLAIATLQKGFLQPAQIAASAAIMGMDTQLIADGTYFVVLENTRIIGCGGWSNRATLFGGDHSAGRDASLLDPATDTARVRAMYTHPDFARQGVGTLVISLCEAAARAAGFHHAEMAATLAGEQLYQQMGYRAVERFDSEARPGIFLPLVRMRKLIRLPK
jgi:GNAT superfamily N-acetyltransferase